MICIDNSEWMRNGDYSPSRLQAQTEAVNLLCGAKTQVKKIEHLIRLGFSIVLLVVILGIFFRFAIAVESGEHGGDLDNGRERS